MRVNHGRFDVLMPQKFLDRPDVVSSFEQAGGKTVPKSVAACRLANVGPPHGLMHGFLDHRLRQVVAHAVENDEPLDPLNIGSLCSPAVMPDSD
jgi:hypothetical protein